MPACAILPSIQDTLLCLLICWLLCFRASVLSVDGAFQQTDLLFLTSCSCGSCLAVVESSRSLSSSINIYPDNENRTIQFVKCRTSKLNDVPFLAFGSVNEHEQWLSYYEVKSLLVCCNVPKISFRHKHSRSLVFPRSTQWLMH
jgi:hypothetical protein